jgi:hypothetical protein
MTKGSNFWSYFVYFIGLMNLYKGSISASLYGLSTICLLNIIIGVMFIWLGILIHKKVIIGFMAYDLYSRCSKLVGVTLIVCGILIWFIDNDIVDTMCCAVVGVLFLMNGIRMLKLVLEHMKSVNDLMGYDFYKIR